jgi:hypothetical protein
VFRLDDVRVLNHFIVPLQAEDRVARQHLRTAPVVQRWPIRIIPVNTLSQLVTRRRAAAMWANNPAATC